MSGRLFLKRVVRITTVREYTLTSVGAWCEREAEAFLRELLRDPAPTTIRTRISGTTALVTTGEAEHTVEELL